jgi:hypothetical protein
MTSIPQESIKYGAVYSNARKNALSRGIPFSLTRPAFDALVDYADGRCMISGIPFSVERIPESSRRPYMPSLDRISSAHGYTVDNVRLVCVLVNIALNEWGMEPLMRIAHQLVARADTPMIAPNLASFQQEEEHMTITAYLRKRRKIVAYATTIHAIAFQHTVRAHCQKRRILYKVEVERTRLLTGARWGLRMRPAFPVSVLNHLYDRAVEYEDRLNARIA